MNDYQLNIQKAQQYVDQTNSGYQKATQETKSAQSAYDKAFSSTPDYGTLYNQYKDQYTKDPEFENMKNSYMLAKDNADAVRTRIDNLGDSINQQFGGTSLSQAQRDLHKNKQLQDLQSQFTEYNANYNVHFKDYQKSVDKAFNEALDVANKSYDGYWNIVRVKYDTWNESIKNEEKWSSSLSTANIQLDNANFNYNMFKREQEWLETMRKHEERMNQINRDYVNATYNIKATAEADNARRMKEEEDRNARKQKFANDTRLFQSGKLSTREYMRRMDAGLYRS